MGSNTKSRLEQKLERRAAKEGIKCFNSFHYFFVTFWSSMSGETFIDAPHIKYICDTLQFWGMKVVRRERIMKTICISVPPGSSKSTIVTIAFNDWLWLHAPNLSTANISYSATLSQQHAYKARAITDSTRWHAYFDNLFKLKHGKPLEIVKQNQTEMLNNFKGNRFCTSVGGTILGMHADIFCKDDLISAEQATSDVQRNSANRWNDETTTSRKKVPDCYLDIYISQRLHEDDAIGHVLNKNIDIVYICLPAEVDERNIKQVSPPEAIELYTDGILDPNRRPKAVLDVIREEMGPNGYAGQYLQVPFDIDEMDINPSMFRTKKEKELPNDIIWDLWIDAAYTEKNENDPTGIDVMAKIGRDIVVKNSYDVRMKLPDLIKFIIDLEQEGIFDGKKSRIFIEPKASGISLAQYIEAETDYNYVLIGENNKSQSKLIQGGKKARHEMIKPKGQSKRIILVEDTWNENFIHQICGFPKVSHDEHVDNLGYAINNYYFEESMFIKQYALDRLEKKVTGAINIKITSQIQRNRIAVSYEENDSGDVQLFDDPNKLYKYRYICVLALKGEGDRGGNTSIVVIDRMTLTVCSMFVSNTINPKKAGLKALEMAKLYDTAKLVVAVQKDRGQTQNEEYDLSHIAIQEARNISYGNIYFRLTQNRIKKTREREWGFEVNQSTSREVYYNMKDMLETAKVKELPLDVFEEIKMLERKKDTGEIGAKEGYQTNSAMAYAVGLKIHDEMYDKPKVKKSEKW
jgi:phage terminase large subunit-like protein